MTKPRKVREAEREFLVGYGKIRTAFIKYDSTDLVSYLQTYICTEYPKGVEGVGNCLPWNQLLLIKWILINSDLTKTKARADQKAAYKILQQAWAFAHKKKLLGGITDVHLFMRPMIFQQTNYQRPFLQSEFGRQNLLFSSLSTDHVFHRQFTDKTGLTFHEFFQYALCLCGWFDSAQKSRFKLSDFDSLKDRLDMPKMELFLDGLSKTLPDVKSYLIEVDDSSGNNRRYEEYLEDTPLYKWPLVRFDQEYWIWYPTLMMRCLESFIYDNLKAIDPNKFMNKFGGIFEEYIDTAIQQTKTPYLREDEIQKYIGDGKCIDFVLHEGADVIFMDAKATEIKVAERFTQAPKRIQDRIKGSVLKAIEQAHAVYSQFDKLKELTGLASEEITPYVLVITYKEHFLGNGVTLSESIAKDKLEAIQDKYPDVTIPLENIYCITVDNFDFMAESVRRGDTTYSGILKAAIAADKKPETKCYNFDLHLNAQGIRGMPDWIRQANVKLFDGMVDFSSNKDVHNT
jgi:hypothetical protein